MSKDLLLGTTNHHWSRDSANCGSLLPETVPPGGVLPAGATGYAPTRWWTQAQASEKIQEFMKSGGIFGTSLPRDVAEKKTLAYLRKNLIGILS
jgi:hypothetical protein